MRTPENCIAADSSSNQEDLAMDRSRSEWVLVITDNEIAFDHHVMAENLSGLAACQIKERDVGRFEVNRFRYGALRKPNRERHVDMREVELAHDMSAKDLHPDRVYPPAGF